MQKIKMATYDVIIGDDILQRDLNFEIKKVYHLNEVFVITDENVYNLYYQKIHDILSAEYRVNWIKVPASEKSKSLETYETVTTKLISLGIKRKHLLIALGGGVVGDLVGFVAATLYRGLPYVQIPTTLLSQIDSSIGGKTGINLPIGKNLLGAFYNPRLVLIDKVFLNTLDQRQKNSGMAEMIKCGLIKDAKLFDLIKDSSEVTTEMMVRTIKVKSHFIKKDPNDLYERMILNFGHTIGHAIEAKKNYIDVTHGEAISYGMLFALDYGIKLGITQSSLYNETKKILEKYDLVNGEIDFSLYLNHIKYDKKNIGNSFFFVLVERKGSGFLKKLTLEEFYETYHKTK